MSDIVAELRALEASSNPAPWPLTLAVDALKGGDA